MTSTPKPTIVLIHGMHMTPASWQGWIDRYQKAGHPVIAPAWPGLEGRSVADIRRDPSALEGLSITTIVDHYDAIVRRLDAPPILVGHSFGGLVVQMLLSRGLGAAGVAVNPAQPSGVPVLPFSTFKAFAPVLLNPFTLNAATSMTPKQFNYAFTNQLDAAASAVVYEEFHIPGAAHLLWEASFGLLNPKGKGAVDFAKADRAPLLLTGGSEDHLTPPAVQKATLAKYRGPAVVEYREFEGRTHHTVGQDGWEEVADYALAWAQRKLAR